MTQIAEKPSRIDGMARSFDQWLNMVPHAVADGSKAQVECALADASHDIEVLWRKVTSQAAEIERLREERSMARARALAERRAANDYAARLAELALKALELARAVLAQSITAGHNVPGPTPEDIEKAFWALDAALKAAMEVGHADH